jgi:putative FmdB family regulatory protein
MPTYLYYCDIHGEFEEMHSVTTELTICPKCIEEKIDPPKSIKKLINCFNQGGNVLLNPDDMIAKARADGKKIAREASKNENLYASLLGEDKYQSLQCQIDKRKH